MAKDVLITPSSGLVDFKDTSGNSDATIQLDDLGNLQISNPGGELKIGDDAANLVIGDGVNSVDILFEQNGAIRALTGKTLTLGQDDSYITIDAPVTYVSPDGSKTITTRMLDADVLSFQGGSGELLSLSDSMTGTIFSVNDVSGIPSIEVNADGTVKLAEFGGEVSVNGSRVLTTADEGSGNGLDADLLDGIHSTGFIRDFGTSTQSNFNTIPVTSGKYRWNNGTLNRPNESNSNEYGTFLNLDYDGTQSTQIAHDINTDEIFIRTLNTSTDVGSTWKRVWTDNNDGSGSGLDADLLDGIQASSFVRGDGVNNGLTTITVNDADFIVQDTTDTITNFIWRDHSENKLMLGTPDVAVEFRSDNITLPGAVVHSGDTDTYMQFHAADEWRVVTGGSERLEVNNTNTTVQNNLMVAGVAITDEIRNRSGQQLVLNAGESTGKVSGQTGESIYINAESGLIVNTPDRSHANWETGYTVDSTVIRGEAITINGNTVFHDGYHPNADKWTTARTLTLGGDLTGSVSIDGSSNFTLTATIATNSVALGTDTTGNYVAGVTSGSGISVSGTAGEGWSPTISHADTSSQASVNNSGTTYIQDITLDTFGHITGIGSATLPTYDNYVSWTAEDGDGTQYTVTSGDILKFAEGSGIDVNFTADDVLTFSHADTSSQSSVNNSNGTVIQDITLDTFGHITAIGSTDLDSRYVLKTGDTMTGTLTFNNGTGTKISLNDSSAYWLATATNWGLYWNTTNNTLEFHGSGTKRAEIDLDNGNAFFAGDTSVKSLTIIDSEDSIVADSSISSWVYEKDFSVSAQETEPRDIFFSEDGTKMYVLGNSGDDINQYALSTPWDIGTAVYQKVFSVSAQQNAPYGLWFRPNGLSFYICGTTGDDVDEYSMSTAWDIGTAAYVRSFAVGAKDTDPQAVAFSEDGTKMYITGTTSDSVHQYNLSTAWNISTAVFSTTLSVSAYASVPQGLDFAEDGTKMYIVGSTFNRIIEWTLSTPWQISTAVFSGDMNAVLLGPYLTNGLSGVYVKASQNKAYVIDYTTDRVFQLDTSIAATRLTGSRFVVDGDTHFEDDVVVYNNIHSNANIYARAGIFSYGSAYVAGTLDVRGAIDLADGDVLRLGSGDDMEIYHTPNVNRIDLNNGDIEIRDDGTTGDPVRFTFGRTTGTFTSLGDVRSPIFYDYNNTAFYIHGDDTSVLNGLLISDDVDDGTVPTKIKFGRDGTQYTTFHGNGSGNRMISVSSSGNPKNFQLRVTDSVNTGTFDFSRTGTLTATTFSGALSGNATTATTLQTARTINGTSFNGSANITTANWGTARTLTLGGDLSGSVSIDGSSNFTLTATVADDSHNHSKITSRGILTAETGRSVHDTGIYTYNRFAGSLGDSTPVDYWSVLAFGNGVNGSAQIAANWTSNGNELWFRSLRDTTDNWYAWKEIIHSDNYTEYTVTKTGSGASGTWGININGNAATASTASTATNLSGGSVNATTGSFTGLIATRTNDAAFASANDSTFSVRGNPSYGAVMSFHRTAAYAVNFGLDTDNVMKLGGWSVSGVPHYWDMSGNAYATASMRSKIFYDQDDTGYFCDPTGMSHLAGLRVGVGGSSYINMVDADEGERLIHCNSHRIGFLNQGGGWGSYCHDDGWWQSESSVRAPIFYDSNDTGFYVDGNNITRLNDLIVNSFLNYSDEKLKNKLGNISNALEKISQLDGFMFEPNDIGLLHGIKNKKQPGLSAQQVREVLEGVVKEDGAYLVLEYHKVIPLLVEAIKELKTKVEILEKSLT